MNLFVLPFSIALIQTEVFHSLFFLIFAFKNNIRIRSYIFNFLLPCLNSWHFSISLSCLCIVFLNKGTATFDMYVQTTFSTQSSDSGPRKQTKASPDFILSLGRTRNQILLQCNIKMMVWFKYMNTHTACGSLNFPTCWMWYMRSPPLTYSITKYSRS